jgi:hypothetical protein
MARRINDVTISDPGRDHGKVFRITEMDAATAEEWAMRALVVLTRAGVDVPTGAGMAGIAIAGLQGLGHVKFEEAKVLLDEMFSCIVRVPNIKNINVTRPLVPDDTEEVATRIRLRAEVFALHTGFSLADVLSKKQTSKKAPASSHGKTSRHRSPR